MKSFTKAFPTIAVLAAVTVPAAQAHDMSDADRQALIENFLQSDTNNDGALYLSEFELLTKRNAGDKLGCASIVVRTGAYGQVFNRLDENRDGAVTRDEIQTLAEERGCASRGREALGDGSGPRATIRRDHSGHQP